MAAGDDNTWIKRIEMPSLEALESTYFQLRVPFIITGAMREWPPSSTWSEAAIRARIGTRVVRARYTDVPDDRPRRYEELTVNEALDRRLYISVVDPLDRIDELRNAIPRPYFLAKNFPPVKAWQAPQLRMLIGHDAHTRCHYHPTGMAALQMAFGRKRLRFFPPWQSPLLYRISEWEPADYSSSRIDMRAPDLSRFPAFAQATPLECTVEAGEILFIPPSWWHSVDSDEYSVSFTYFWHLTDGRWTHVSFPEPGLRDLVVEYGVPLAKKTQHILRRGIGRVDRLLQRRSASQS